MSMPVTSVHTSDRLYLGVNQSEEKMKEAIFANGKENKGLGIREYGAVKGWLLSLIGISFKSTDTNGKSVYLNKKSFCSLLARLKHNDFKTESVQEEYEKGVRTDEVKRIVNVFDKVFDPKKRIDQISFDMLNKM